MKKLRLLLVDDEQEFVETLADRLKMRDLEPSIAQNGEEALSAVKEEEPDVIVLDLKMPGIHGIEVLRRVKEAYPNVEVIILTGHGSKKDEEAARRLGAFDYLRKPADLDSLVRRINNAFTRKMKKLETMSMAAAFAEAGEFDTAREMMMEEEEEKKKKKKKKKTKAIDSCDTGNRWIQARLTNRFLPSAAKGLRWESSGLATDGSGCIRSSSRPSSR